MKKAILISVVLMVVSCISNQVFAQEAITKQRTKSNNTNERNGSTNQWPILTVKISPTENGCSIVFDNAIVSPRDAASGLPTGKRQHKPISFVINPSENTIVEVKNTTEKNVSPTTENAKSTGTPIGGIIVKGGKNPGGTEFDKIVVTNGEFSLPVDLSDGNYELSISFTYQKIELATKDAKNSKSYVSGHFILEIDGGSCRSINEAGVSVKSTR
jgi:hypothetical protein